MSGEQLDQEQLEPRDPEAIQRGAVQGVSVMLARTVGLQLITAGATIALARILSPEDYGAFAVAVAVQLLAKNFMELGLPVALIRREAAPTLLEQRAITGFMLAAGFLLLVVVAAIAFVALPALGVETDTGKVAAVACCALPLWALRVVPVVSVERRLEFRRLVAIEISETLAFYLFALPAAIAGLGPFSLAAGVPFAALSGAIVANAANPWPFGIRFTLAPIRGLARFGAQASLLTPAHLAREVGIVSVLAAVGGQSVAGFYSIAQRLFSLPIAILGAIYRVSTAALARAGDAGEDRGRLAGRAIGVTTVATALPLTLAVGAAYPLITLLFGQRWEPSAEVVTAGATGLLLASASAVLVGLCLADEDARTPVLSAGAGAAAAVAVAAPLAKAMGAAGGGLSSSLGFAVGMVVLVVGAEPRLRRAVLPALAATLVAALAAAAGQLSIGGTDLADLAVALTVSGTAWLALSLLLTRQDLLDLVRLVRRHALSRATPARSGDDPLVEVITETESAGV